VSRLPSLEIQRPFLLNLFLQFGTKNFPVSRQPSSSRLVRELTSVATTLFGNPKTPSEFGTAASQAAASARLTLLPLEDWELWSTVLKHKATSLRLRVWDYVDPDMTAPEAKLPEEAQVQRRKGRGHLPKGPSRTRAQRYEV
jgi:hypothetical protein